MSELCRLLRSEGYEACGDEDELNIVCTKKEEVEE